jgi:hypothetical protein
LLNSGCNVEKDHLSLGNIGSSCISDVPLDSSRKLRKRGLGRKQDAEGNRYDLAEVKMGASGFRRSD